MRSCALAFIGAAAIALGATLVAQSSVPEIPFDGDVNVLKLPEGMNLGEASGVAVNSKGEIAVFTRSNSAGGPAYGATAAQVLLSTRPASSSARSAKGSTPGRTRTRSASTRTTTSGRSTRART